MTNQNNLVWFRNNLRVSDNTILRKACQTQGKVIAVYYFDPRHFEETRFGFPKTGTFRARFLIETIQDLKENLAKLNITLIVKHEKPEEGIPQLVVEHDIEHLYFQMEWTKEEQDVEDAIREQLSDSSVGFKSYYDQFLFHPNDIPYEDNSQIPKVYTNFRKACEKKAKVRPLAKTPEKREDSNTLKTETKLPGLPDLGLKDIKTDNRTAFPFQGGETNAHKRMQEYHWDTKNIANYKKTRNGLVGKDYSSKYSAWLANGSLSARQVYHDVKAFENKETSNQSTYWMIFELIWRDFFKYIALKHKDDIFKINGILNKDYDWKTNEKALREWINGNTIYDFVNANMLEIKHTGWMSNRGRQNVASFWAKELQQDWRIGASYFESQLIDYDVHSNYGNWMYNSGVGNDPRDRKFNIESQADRYDNDREFRDLWLKS